MDAGILPIDKPEGPTSHDVVAAVRRSLDERRVGHTGTLDPFASGLLLVCVGWATRIAEYLTGLDKAYTARLRLGVRTDSDDREGRILARTDAWHALDAARIREAAGSLTGRIEQRPPAFSAKKVQGERAHRLARQGRPPELAPVEVTVHELTVTNVDLPDVDLRVRCGSGTYVRALGRDLGELLGVGAHLTALRRTHVGVFDVADALPLAALEDGSRVERARLRPGQALEHLPAVRLSVDEAREIGFGRAVAPSSPLPEPAPTGPMRALQAGRLLAVGEWRNGRFQPRKVFG